MMQRIQIRNRFQHSVFIEIADFNYYGSPAIYDQTVLQYMKLADEIAGEQNETWVRLDHTRGDTSKVEFAFLEENDAIVFKLKYGSE